MEMVRCVWEGCTRYGAVHQINAPFCARHHPAGRAHIETYEAALATIAANLTDEADPHWWLGQLARDALGTEAAWR